MACENAKVYWDVTRILEGGKRSKFRVELMKRLRSCCR